MAARAYQRDGSLSGLATGLTDLDTRMGGLQPSDLVILAGRPGMGKTALATNIAYNVAKAWAGEVRADGHMATVNGGIVGFFSLEMSAEQLATRIISEQTGIPSNKIRRGGIDEGDFEKIKDVSIELQNLPFYVDETGGLSVGQLAARARRLKSWSVGRASRYRDDGDVRPHSSNRKRNRRSEVGTKVQEGPGCSGRTRQLLQGS